MSKVSAISLGCPKNLVDTEIMLGILKEQGYEITFNPEEADVLIINTCAFLEKAREESKEVITEYTGKYKKLIVAGCLVQLYGEKLLDEFPEIDHLIGVGEINKIHQTIADEKQADLNKESYQHSYPRIIATLPHTAYVKIADGCNNCCSYCLIPSLRGKYQSRDMDSIIKEVDELVTVIGSREINLIAQDITLYGKDTHGRLMLPELLKQLTTISDNLWIRLMYTHPAHVTDELIEIMAKFPNICHYIDLPVQHISDSILQAMNRKVSSQQIKELINRLRQSIPDIALRTSLIVGFPGEGEDEFKMLLDFVEETRFEHLGVFPYSKEHNTPAFDFPNQVDEKVKEERQHQIMKLQKKVSFKKKKKKIGKTLDIIIEGYIEQGMFGRSQYEAPEIDGVIYIKGRHRKMGEIVPVKIIAATEYDLVGTIC
ncbi:30S ribosomal protein S12 methylthiotransferase RimO [bacterium]|nr:30S ribosomal protein S12 methylthiotransferase RimO [bacterium]MBU1752682.1 30S ribosomal protein S12 methylthiotransferase RimO [bacterium]